MSPLNIKVPRWLGRLLFIGYGMWRRVFCPLTIGVRVMIIEEGRLCLVKPIYLDYWTLPGGGMKRGESAMETGLRETREETGVLVGSLRLVGVYYNPHLGKQDHVFLFRGTMEGREEAHSWEIERWGFFPLDALPAPLSPALRRRLQERTTTGAPVYGEW